MNDTPMTPSARVMDEAGERAALIREALRRKVPGMLEAEEAWADDLSDIFGARKQRDELRAILAPKLDDPYSKDDNPTFCIFCDRAKYYHEGPHKPDCPVLRKDELLGR